MKNEHFGEHLGYVLFAAVKTDNITFRKNEQMTTTKRIEKNKETKRKGRRETYLLI